MTVPEHPGSGASSRRGACPRCHLPGQHFVPPSFGDTGFYMCDPNDAPKPSRTPENYVMPCSLCPDQIMAGAWVELGRGRYAHAACAEEEASHDGT